MAAKPGQLAPALPAIGRAKQGRVLDARIHGVGVGQGGLKVPNAVKLPRMRRAVVPLMCTGNAVVDKLIAHRPPGLATIVRSLNNLAKPAAGLRRIQPIGVHRRAFHMIDLPAGKVRSADLPVVALAIRRQDKRALLRSNQQSYGSHTIILLVWSPKMLDCCAALTEITGTIIEHIFQFAKSGKSHTSFAQATYE